MAAIVHARCSGARQAREITWWSAPPPAAPVGPRRSRPSELNLI